MARCYPIFYLLLIISSTFKPVLPEPVCHCPSDNGIEINLTINLPLGSLLISQIVSVINALLNAIKIINDPALIVVLNKILGDIKSTVDGLIVNTDLDLEKLIQNLIDIVKVAIELLNGLTGLEKDIALVKTVIVVLHTLLNVIATLSPVLDLVDGVLKGLLGGILSGLLGGILG